MDNVRKIAGYILIALIIAFTVVALLGIWEVINLREVLMKTLYSLLVVFIASAVILFITTIMARDEKPDNKQLEK